jgi:hemerythrin
MFLLRFLGRSIKRYTIYFLQCRYGQLGCSGFIVSDRQGCFECRKTKAYLQHGDDAFLHVEELLHQKFTIQPWTEEDRSSEEEDVLNPNWVLPSVGVDSMDHEHEECEEALALLLRTHSAESLRKALEKLTEHFQHEESLMKSSGFGRPGESFSPYANHVKDHERILDIGYFELAKLTKTKEPHKSFLAMTCSHTQPS